VLSAYAGIQYGNPDGLACVSFAGECFKRGEFYVFRLSNVTMIVAAIMQLVTRFTTAILEGIHRVRCRGHEVEHDDKRKNTRERFKQAL
jgi:hypothetical protein